LNVQRTPRTTAEIIAPVIAGRFVVGPLLMRVFWSLPAIAPPGRLDRALEVRRHPRTIAGIISGVIVGWFVAGPLLIRVFWSLPAIAPDHRRHDGGDRWHLWVGEETVTNLVQRRWILGEATLHIPAEHSSLFGCVIKVLRKHVRVHGSFHAILLTCSSDAHLVVLFHLDLSAVT
jgi:hypothetical protein